MRSVPLCLSSLLSFSSLFSFKQSLGFHPNQIAHSLIAENLWGRLLQDHPTFLGETNPNNPTIAQLFGDQGGY